MTAAPQPGSPPEADTGAAGPGPSAAGVEAVLDAQALAGLATLDPTGANRLVHRVLATYQGSLGRLLGQISDTWARSDLAGLRLAAHTLKSSSASIGALELSRLCAATETALREGRVDVVPDLVETLLREAGRVELAVRDRLAT